MKKKALDDDLAAFTKNIDEKKTETMMISVFHFILADNDSSNQTRL